MGSVSSGRSERDGASREARGICWGKDIWDVLRRRPVGAVCSGGRVVLSCVLCSERPNGTICQLVLVSETDGSRESSALSTGVRKVKVLLCPYLPSKRRNGDGSPVEMAMGFLETRKLLALRNGPAKRRTSFRESNLVWFYLGSLVKTRTSRLVRKMKTFNDANPFFAIL